MSLQCSPRGGKKPIKGATLNLSKVRKISLKKHASEKKIKRCKKQSIGKVKRNSETAKEEPFVVTDIAERLSSKSLQESRILFGRVQENEQKIKRSKNSESNTLQKHFPLLNAEKVLKGSDSKNKIVNVKKRSLKRDVGNKIKNMTKKESTKQDNVAEKMTVPECGFYLDNKGDTDVINNFDTSSDDETENELEPKQKKKKLSAAERREVERQKEREIREREEALASNQMPSSVDQFDRLVLSSPDSSLVWLQFMAYYLQATEIEKARAVARRAIKTINFREENERLNVWNGWLNLESKFGSPESLNDVFQEAVRTNDAIKVYTHMLAVHVDAGRQIELEKIVNTMIRKFKQDPQMWIDCGSALLKLGLKDKSRHIMQRALQSLPPSNHVNLMVRFAQLENKYGDKERSQTLFEHILSSYPKRVDVWSTYVDALVKSGDIDIARKVLERAVVQTLPARKMKTLFKKFITFEEQHGTTEGVEHVKQMAVDYVENQSQKELM